MSAPDTIHRPMSMRWVVWCQSRLSVQVRCSPVAPTFSSRWMKNRPWTWVTRSVPWRTRSATGWRSSRNRIGCTTPRVSPRSAAASTTCCAPARFIAMGISTRVCLPCSSDAIAMSAWVSLGPATITMSTSGSSSASFRSVVHFLYPNRAANSSVDAGLRPPDGLSPTGPGGRPATVCSRQSARRNGPECHVPIIPWPIMQTFNTGFLLGSSREPAHGYARDVHAKREDAAGQRFRREYVAGQAMAQRRDEDGPQIRGAETGHRRSGTRQRYRPVQLPVRRPPVEDAGRDARAPVVPLHVGGGTVRPADLLGRAGDQAPVPDGAVARFVVVGPDRAGHAVGVVHGPAVGGPRQPVGHDQALHHRLDGAVDGGAARNDSPPASKSRRWKPSASATTAPPRSRSPNEPIRRGIGQLRVPPVARSSRCSAGARMSTQ